MDNLYPDETEAAIDILFENDYTELKVHNGGSQINVRDKSGVTQSYYPTTGTMLFHRSNDWKDRKIKSIYNGNIETFVDYINNPNKIEKLFN